MYNIQCTCTYNKRSKTDFERLRYGENKTEGWFGDWRLLDKIWYFIIINIGKIRLHIG